MGGKWLVCTLVLSGCGAEFMPSAQGNFPSRTGWEQVLVIDPAAPELAQYATIGTVIARARKSKNAVAACRKEAADHGGDAISPKHIRGGEWECSVLRRHYPAPVVVVPTPPPAEAVDAPPPPPKKKHKRKSS